MYMQRTLRQVDKLMTTFIQLLFFQQPWGRSWGDNRETKGYEDRPNSRLESIWGFGSNLWNCPKSRSRLALGCHMATDILSLAVTTGCDCPVPSPSLTPVAHKKWQTPPPRGVSSSASLTCSHRTRSMRRSLALNQRICVSTTVSQATFSGTTDTNRTARPKASCWQQAPAPPLDTTQLVTGHP